MFLCYVLVAKFQYTETRAAEYAAELIHKSDRTVRQWHTDLVANDGVMPESKQGRFQRSGVLWSNEDLNKKVTEYVRINGAVKGTPNMTTREFCKWVNKSLLLNWTLEPDSLGMKADQMRETLGKHEDFKNEKCMLEHFLLEKGHIPIFLPKFHPELNPIERVWAQLKRYTKGHCKYTLPSLRKNIPLAYDSVTLENIQNHFRKVRHFMFGYLEGLAPGKELDQALQKYKITAKSHRRIGINE